MRFTVMLKREEDGGFAAIVPALQESDVVHAVESAPAGRGAGTGGLTGECSRVHYLSVRQFEAAV